MYSDSDLENFELEVHSADSDDGSSNGVESRIQRLNDDISTRHQAYCYLFDDTDGFFRECFPELYIDPKVDERQRASIAAWYPSSADVSAILSNCITGQEDVTNSEESDSLAESPSEISKCAAPKAAPPPLPRWAPMAEDGKPSPASRFLCTNQSACILIPVGKSINRAALKAEHQARFANVPSIGSEGLDLVPGYVQSDAVGWALPMSIDPAVLSALKELYPGWRPATPSDVKFFTKPKRSHPGPGPNTSTLPDARRAGTRAMAKLMRSKERLLACVAAAGGWAAVTFVAVDIEAYNVGLGSIPIPAEYAFVPIRNTFTNDAPAPLHFFCHPGQLQPEDEATVLYTCIETHLIPYRSATFLSVDFEGQAREMDSRFVRNPKVILINKGAPSSPTLMDVQALRWLYVAAMCQRYPDGDFSALASSPQEVGHWVPTAENVHCFDISVLESVAAACGDPLDSANDAHTTVEPFNAPYCWYHEKADTSGLLPLGAVHCAMRDAHEVAKRIETALRTYRPSRLA